MESRPRRHGCDIDQSDDGFTGAIGIGIVTADAFAIGATAMPGPLSDMSFSWLYHSFFNLFSFATGQEFGQGMTGVRIAIDSKGMRIQDASEVLFGMVETTELGAAALEFVADTRTLDKLS